MLCAYEWKPVHRGSALPPHAVCIGKTFIGEPFYVARNSAGECGKLSVKDDKVWSIFCHQSGEVQDGEVFVVNGSLAVEWRPVRRGDLLPTRSVWAGRTQEQGDVFVGRTMDGECGKLALKSGRVYGIYCIGSRSSVQEGEALQINPGLAAPLEEKGYQCLLAQGDEAQMGLFIERTLQKLGRAVAIRSQFKLFVRLCNSACGVTSYARLCEELRTVPWAQDITQMDSAPDGALIETAPYQNESWPDPWLVKAPSHGLQCGSRGSMDVRVWVGTWNLQATEPFAAPETRSREVIQRLFPSGYDLYLLGVQECASDDLFETLESYLRQEGVRRISLVMQAGPWHRNASCRRASSGVPQVVGHGDGSLLSTKFTGLAVYASARLVARGVRITGFGNSGLDRLSSKGAAVVAFVLDSGSQAPVTFSFVSSHLQAGSRGSSAETRRIQYRELTDGLSSIVCAPGLEMLTQFQHVVWVGDLNFRCVNGKDEKYSPMEAEAVLDALEAGETRRLFKEHDDLNWKRWQGEVFYDYCEPEPYFPSFIPTYKLQEERPEPNTSEPGWTRRHYRTLYKEPFYKGGQTKARTPGFCDRILFHSQADMRQNFQPEAAQVREAADAPKAESQERCHNYRSVQGGEGFGSSDHAPVFATFKLRLPGDPRIEELEADEAESTSPETCPRLSAWIAGSAGVGLEDDGLSDSSSRQSDEVKCWDIEEDAAPSSDALAEGTLEPDSVSTAEQPPRQVPGRRSERSSPGSLERAGSPGLNEPPPNAGFRRPEASSSHQRSHSGPPPRQSLVAAMQRSGSEGPEIARRGSGGLFPKVVLPTCPASLTISKMCITWEGGPSLQPAGCEVVFPAPFEVKPTSAGLPCVSLLPTSSWLWQQASPDAMSLGALRAVLAPALTTQTVAAAAREECGEWPPLVLLWWGVGGAAALEHMHLLICLLGDDNQASTGARANALGLRSNDSLGLRPNALGQLSVALGPLLQDALPLRRRSTTSLSRRTSDITESAPQALRAHVRQPLVYQGSPEFSRGPDGQLHRKYVEFEVVVQFQADADDS